MPIKMPISHFSLRRPILIWKSECRRISGYMVLPGNFAILFVKLALKFQTPKNFYIIGKSLLFHAENSDFQHSDYLMGFISFHFYLKHIPLACARSQLSNAHPLMSRKCSDRFLMQFLWSWKNFQKSNFRDWIFHPQNPKKSKTPKFDFLNFF